MAQCSKQASRESKISSHQNSRMTESFESEDLENQNVAVIYFPPSDEAIKRLVHDASLRLAAKSGDQRYLDPEITWGLAAFIKLVGEIKAKQLNREKQASALTPLTNRGILLKNKAKAEVLTTPRLSGQCTTVDSARLPTDSSASD